MSILNVYRVGYCIYYNYRFDKEKQCHEPIGRCLYDEKRLCDGKTETALKCKIYERQQKIDSAVEARIHW